MRAWLSDIIFWVVAAVVILFMVFLGVQPAEAGDLYGAMTWRSYHADREAGYNERNTGIGLEYQFNKTWSLAAGEYKNSFAVKSNYYGGAWTPFQAGEDWKAGLFLLQVSGYDFDNPRRFIPVAAPLIVWERNGFGVNTVFVPPVGHKSGMVAVQFKLQIASF